ncbi:MAG TPA: porphobilinogen synthase [Candidatus Saccharimonadales bacterium]|nr:porphobilinogen synthase [Candidatus Saccharimonadales bacterium]
MAAFPITRLRRLRKSNKLRDLISETDLSIKHFIYPLFISEQINKPLEINAMPGIMQWPLGSLKKEVKRIQELGIPAVLLFGIPKKKDALGTQAYAKSGIIQKAIKEIKASTPNLMVITDVCLCEYTDHGHCGVIKKGEVQNDPSLKLLSKMALSHVEAGADMVAPSDMMDGRVGAIRKILDLHNFETTPIMAYSAKYASGFYGPFREAAKSTPQFGDRRAYQMDPRNVKEALREIELDIEEGADIIMVKPALSYLDVIAKVKQKFDIPLAAYNVSGEYSMVKAASQNGWIDEKRVVLEILTGIKRAGADIIISYFAPQVATWLMEKNKKNGS